MSDRFGNIPIDPPEKTTATRLAAAKKRIAQSAGSKPPPKPKEKKEKRGPVRVWSSLVIIVLFFALYSCVGFLGVPYYLTDIFPESFHQQTGMVLQPGKVKFNPLTFHFALDDTKIASSEGTVLVSLKSLVSDLAPLSLLRLDMVCNSLAIEELDLNLTREKDGSYDFQALLGKKEINDPAAIMNFSDLPFFFSLNNITISNSSIYFHDIPAGREHKVEQIQLSLPTFSNISFQADNYLNPRFSAVINGSPIELSGQASMGGEQKATKLSCAIKDLDLVQYASYIPLKMPLQFKGGKAEGKFDLSFDPTAEKGHKFAIGFDASISGLELTDDDGAMDLTAEAARLTGELLPVSRQIHLEHIALRTPVIDAYGASLTGSFSSLMTDSKNDPETVPAVSPPPLELVADLCIIDNGIIRHFADKKGKKAEREFHSLQLAIKGYSSKPSAKRGETPGSARMNGEMRNSSAQFSFEGTFPTPTSIAGTLNITKTPAADLLKATGGQQPFAVKGTADLKGQLQIVVNTEEAKSFSYSVAETEVSILDFQFLDHDTVLLKAPLVRIGPLSYQNSTEKRFDFGSIDIENGSGFFQYRNVPKSLTVFGTTGYLLHQLDFSGSLTISKQGTKARPLIFTDFTVKADELAGDVDSRNFSCSGTTSSGATLQGEGLVQLYPFGLTATTTLKNFRAREIFPFFTDHPLVSKVTGELSGTGRLILPKPQFNGDLQLFDGALTDDSGRHCSWQQAIFRDVQFGVNPSELKIASVAVEAPEFGWSFGANDLDPMQEAAAYLRANLPKRPRTDKDKEKPQYYPLKISELTINNGAIELEDARLSPKWQGRVAELSGKIAAVDSESTDRTSSFDLSGKLDDTPFTYKGDIGFAAAKPSGRRQFRLSRYPLASFHEQLSARLDIDNSDGEFTLSDDSEWRADQFTGSAEFTFSDVAPVSPAADSAIPLALLTRPDGTFALTVEHTAGNSSPGRGLFEQAVNHFQTLVVKSAVSPFLLTGDTFSDLIGRGAIEFKPGEIVLTEEGQKLLGRYIDLLNSHPHIGLHLTGGIAPQLDIPAIRKKLEDVEQARVDRENSRLFTEWQQKKEQLEKKFEEKQQAAEQRGEIAELDLSAADLKEFVPLAPVPITIDDDIVLDLAEKRINILYTHIASRLPLAEDRITLDPPKTLNSVGSASSPAINISLRPFGI